MTGELDPFRRVSAVTLQASSDEDERLRHHLVGAGPQCDQPVLELRRRTEHHERDVGHDPDPVDDRPFVHTLALGVDHQQLRSQLREQSFGRAPRRRALDHMIVISQSVHDCFCEKLVPAYHENARAISAMSAR
jgi:hypothetical protein